jgi:hypothetical protein
MFNPYLLTKGVGIAAGFGWTASVLIPGRCKIFLFFTASRLWDSPSLLIQFVPTPLSPGLKRMESESVHSPP